MCGLAGVVRVPRDGAGVPDAGRRLRAAVEAQSHRGPDGRGVWVAADGAAGLGHARLSIIDLAGGAQPLRSEDGRVHLVVSGEFYDHQRLRAELVGRGHGFRTGSDSEVALHLYEELGAGFLRSLRGEFALILYDERTGTLLGARDRFGVRPLCWAEQDGALWLASEVKGLLAAGVEAAWDEAAFAQAAALQYLLPEQTLFRGVRQVPPGHYLLCRDGRVQVLRYWDMDYPVDGPAGPVDERAAVDELRARLDEAVRVRLQADVPVCFQLSGGLDSSAVVGLARRHLDQPPHCFTVGFGDAEYDEMAIAAETAAHVGAVHHRLALSEAELLDSLPAAIAHGEGLAINLHIAAKHRLSQAVREAGFKVLLTGEGADEVLGGYAHLRQDLLEGAGDAAGVAALGAANPVTAGVHLPHGAGLPMEAAARRLGYVPTFLRAKGTLGRRSQEVLDAGFVARHAGRDPVHVLLDQIDVEGQLRGRARVHQSQYLWSKLSLAGYILRTLGDGMELAHGVEGRVPFLDPPLFEFVRGLPVDLKIRRAGSGGYVDSAQRSAAPFIEKYVLRQAMAGVVTERVRGRRKHPFMAPPLSAAADGFLRDWLGGRALDAVPFYDRRAMLGLLDALPGLPAAERVAAEPVLVMALSACVLAQRYRL